MKILVAPDSFKGSLSAREAAEAIGRGVRSALPNAEVELCPLADGGEGTLEVLVAAKHGTTLELVVTGPLGEPVVARLGLFEDGGERCAVLDMADAAGLAQVPVDRRDPTRTTTHGVGELVSRALDERADRVRVGVGGSATIDGGTGLAQALGVRFGGSPAGAMCGGWLAALESIDAAGLDARLTPGRIEVLCDVTNPLLGERGAARVYGPQKGATPAQVEELECGLARLAELLPHADRDAPGAGAAGGAAFGLAALCKARLTRGIEVVLDAIDFDARLAGASLVVTGEGRLDDQSLEGKACSGVLARAAHAGVPVVALAGSRGGAYTMSPGAFAAVHALTDSGRPQSELVRDAALWLERLASEHVRCH